MYLRIQFEAKNKTIHIDLLQEVNLTDTALIVVRASAEKMKNLIMILAGLSCSHRKSTEYLFHDLYHITNTLTDLLRREANAHKFRQRTETRIYTAPILHSSVPPSFIISTNMHGFDWLMIY